MLDRIGFGHIVAGVFLFFILLYPIVIILSWVITIVAWAGIPLAISTIICGIHLNRFKHFEENNETGYEFDNKSTNTELTLQERRDLFPFFIGVGALLALASFICNILSDSGPLPFYQRAAAEEIQAKVDAESASILKRQRELENEQIDDLIEKCVITNSRNFGDLNRSLTGKPMQNPNVDQGLRLYCEKEIRGY